MATKEKHTEATVAAALAEKYSGQEWAFVRQVPNATGLEKTRTCDAMAMGLWPSKGLHLHGFEIKVTRSDWLTEIQDRTKAAAFERFCHYWYIAAPPGIVKVEEMPAEWGLISTTKSGGVRIKKAASLRQPEPIDFDLLAGIFRACVKQSASEEHISAAYDRGYQEGRKTGEKSAAVASHHRIAERELEMLKAALAAFEKASGIEIAKYSGPHIGAQFQLAGRIMHGLRFQGELNRMANTLERFSERIKKLSDEASRIESGDIGEDTDATVA